MKRIQKNNLVRSFFVIFVLFFFSTPRSAFAALPWLKTTGNKIVTQNTGKEVILRGANFMRSEWDNDMIWENGAIPEMGTNWKGNVVLRGFACNPVNNNDSTYLGFLDQYVSLTKANNMYMIFAWRSDDINGAQPSRPDACAQQALAALAARYKNESNVIYALQVEPHDYDWATMRPQYETMVDAIREAAAPNVPLIMVPGINWSRDVSGAITDPVNRPDIVYKSHPYNASSYFQSEFVDTYNAGLPVFIGEFGPDGTSGPSDMNQTDVNTLLSLTDQLHIGWAAWIFDPQGIMSLLSDTYVPTNPYGTSIKNEMVLTPSIPDDTCPSCPTSTPAPTPTPAPPTPTLNPNVPHYIQSNYSTATNGAASSTVSLAMPPTVGNTVIVAAGISYGDFPTSSAVTDTAGNTYTQVGDIANGACRVGIYYAKNIKSANPFTVTVKDSQPGDITIGANEYSNVSGVDKTSSLAGSTAAVSSGNVTTTIANELYFGAMTQCGVTAAISQGTGYTLRQNLTDASFMVLSTEDKTGNAETTNASWSMDSSQPWAGTLATFIPITNVSPTGPSLTPTPIIGNGDANGDGKVDVNDLKTILTSWLQKTTGNIDQYGDGLINSLDFTVTALRITNPSPTMTPLTPTLTSAPTPTGGVSGSVQGLHVSGNKLLNGAGETIILHGANRMSTEYACIQGWGFSHGPIDAGSVMAMKTWKGLNAIRVPLNEDCWLGINGVSSTYGGANYRSAISNFVTYLTQNNIVAIMDLHWNAPGTQQATGQEDMADQDHAPAFWTSVANTFKGNSSVIFDLYNEPFPDNNQDTTTAWTCWRDGTSSTNNACSSVAFPAAGMQELVTTVRNTGATNVILLGGVSYAAHLSQWLTYKPTDPLNNLMASAHIYPVLEGGGSSQCADSTCWNSEIAPVAAQVPVILGETGQANYTTTNDLLTPLISFADSHGIGYTPWAWIAGGTALDMITDYTTGSPTTYGAYFKNHYAGF